MRLELQNRTCSIQAGGTLILFHPNGLDRYSLGAKKKDLKFNTDGSLTLCAAAKSPGGDEKSNWLPAPNGPFSLYIRAYWGQEPILDST
jgi:hypothetical protein